MSVLQIIICIVGVLTLLLTVGGIGVKWILSGQNDIKTSFKSVLDLHDKRLDKHDHTLATHSADFMPKSEIESKFKHETAGRATLNQAMLHFNQKLTEDVTNVRVEMGKLQTEHHNLKHDVADIKNMIKDGRAETKEDFAEVKRCMAEIARDVKA